MNYFAVEGFDILLLGESHPGRAGEQFTVGEEICGPVVSRGHCFNIKQDW